ncbi:MAG: phosphoribosylamine--glycine ligase [Promethearchaeota archaeon CR_4]|nr:MAG: phosphoribosylamine--glycine ligase [Candidatus Lokiarchaeota archaeon CR_4]
MVKVILVGNGAREHAIAEALVRGGAILRAFMAARNPGITKLCNNNIKIGKLDNFEALASFAEGCDFAVVGPEAPLVVVCADALQSAGIPCVGPTIQCAQLEGSKDFTRRLLDKYNISSNVPHTKFSKRDYDRNAILSAMETYGAEGYVLKPDGLTGGKGVRIAGEHLKSYLEGLQYATASLDSGDDLVVEERCEGEEFTLQTFVDGTHVVGTPLVQDHKRAFEGDQGPNTGGMGSYSMPDGLMPFVNQADVDQAILVMEKTVRAVKQETTETYKGFLYGQFMKTPKGIRLIEYNVRFGDPEAMNVLPIMESNFVEVCQKILDGTLGGQLRFQKKATVTKYLVPTGYPDNPAANALIEVNTDTLQKVGAKYYFASVDERDDKIYTSKSRAIGILGIADTLEQAEQVAEHGTACIQGNLYHRRDVGTKNLLQKRIDHMNRLMSKK